MSDHGLDATRVEPDDGDAVTFLTGRGANFPALASWGCMGAITGCEPGRHTTVALLGRIMRGERGLQLRAKLANANPSATPELVDEAFQIACIRAEHSCHGQTEGEVYVWLRTTAHREIGHLRKRAENEVPVDTFGAGFDPLDPEERTVVDELIDREDEAEIRSITTSILDRLSERQRAIIALHTHGRSRSQIADHLDISPRVVKRSIERVLTAGRDELVRLAGHGCDSGEALVARFAFGLASSREASKAQMHLATCARCGALYERLDIWREKVAVLLPVPAVAGAHSTVIERAVHTGTDVLAEPAGPAGEGHHGVRKTLGDVGGHLRDHATSMYARTVDPTPLAGARPGAVAAAVAGCLAIGGGATYCVDQGMGPIARFAGIDTPDHAEKDKPRPRNKARAAQIQTPAPAIPPAVTTPPAPPPETTTPPAATTPAPLPPAPEDEYEPSSATASAKPAPAPKPKAVPAGSAPEFGGP